MNTIKSVFLAVMLFFGFSVVSANQASEVKKLHCVIVDISEDIEDFPIKPDDASSVYNDYIVPLMNDKNFVKLMEDYKKFSSSYIADTYAKLAEINYLVDVREYFNNNKPKYDNKNIDKGLYEIEKIILTKTNDINIPNKSAIYFENVNDYIEKFLEDKGVSEVEDYAYVIMFYFIDLSSSIVNVEDIFKSKNIKEVLNYVSSHIIENGTAKDLEYKTGKLNAYDFISDVSIKAFLISKE